MRGLEVYKQRVFLNSGGKTTAKTLSWKVGCPMKLVDRMYELYKDQLVGDEEDAVLIVTGVLEDLEREHMLEWIQEMSNLEVYEMLGNYLVDKLKTKMAEEGLGKHDGMVPHDGVIH